VASNGFPAGKTMTSQIANYLFTSGKVPLSYFTGSATDATTTVFATGRNPDSGTRTTAVVETGIGTSALLKQYKPTISGNNVTSHQLYPVEIVNGTSTGQPGNSGEDTGAIVRGFLNKTLATGLADAYSATTPSYYLTYLGSGDANTVTGAGTLPAVELAYNGVTYSTSNFVPVQQGQYTFWGAEHLMHNLGSGIQLNFANALIAKIKATASSASGVQLSTMNVHRNGDGGIVLTGVYP
jgi:hypothetical protein